MTFEQGFFVGFVVCQLVFFVVSWKTGVAQAIIDYLDQGKKSRDAEVRRVAAQLMAGMNLNIGALEASEAAVHRASVLVNTLDDLQHPRHEPPGREK